ncbi:thioredoxin family protein [Geofilum sp. OHC36d9]|uniref:thioredoxin family protein n=1 Tax=Geofilum sp. OHC36d9 TaxID=3458413 RepID=UPI0040335337
MNKLKKIASGLFIFIFAVSLQMSAAGKEEAKGINFHQGTWNEALELAKKENKLIFLDISASWCPPCKMLKANTFTNAEVGSLYNNRFINVALDGEKGEGISLARDYQVTAYPTLLFINGDGKVVKKSMGYHTPEQFLDLGQSVK